MANEYITQAEFTLRIDENDEISETGGEIDSIDQIIVAVSRLIDRYCGRKFYLSTETRYYTPEHTSHLMTGDLMSVTTLKTDDNIDYTYENVWDSSRDYDLWPYSAQSNSANITPYQMIEVKYGSFFGFSRARKSVEIAGKFGYCTATTGDADAVCPKDVKEACYLQCVKQYKRRKSPTVVLGSESPFGTIKVPDALDPDVKAFLSAYRKIR